MAIRCLDIVPGPSYTLDHKVSHTVSRPQGWVSCVHAPRARYGPLLLAIYLASVALVCSFILFEVLDIDGSDFPVSSASVDVRPAEAHHDDLKRAMLALALAFAPLASLVVHGGLTLGPRLEPRAVPRAVCFTPSLDTHVLLPRAALGDGSAA